MMKMLIRNFFINLIFIFISLDYVALVEANAVVKRREQQQQQQQQQMQQQVMNARQQAYEQAMQAQQQLQQMAQQNQQQTQQALQAVRNGYVPPAEINYQSTNRSAPNTTTIVPKSPFNSSDLPEPFKKDPPPARKESIKTIGEVWQELETSSYIWLKIMDMHGKEITVSRQKELFRAQGAVITKPSFFYVELIDRMARENPDMLKAPFKDVLRVLAIMEYDFDIGRDKDELARQVLGEDIYWTNRQRLGL